MTVLALGFIGGASYWGLVNHPDYASPRGAAAQARIVEVFGVAPEHDALVIGDFVIERFYAIDPTTAELYVGDLCRGRVANVFESVQPDGMISYTLNLDRQVAPSELAKITASMPAAEDGVTYLGVRIQAGSGEALPLNYNGSLPREWTAFHNRLGNNPREFLKKIASGAWRPTLHLMDSNGTNYILSSSERYPHLSTAFGLKGAIVLSNLEFVDIGTSDDVSSR